MPRTELNLACRDGKERFYAVLSEARLHVLAVKSDTRVTLHGRTNLIGTYIDRIDIAPAAQATC
jgi:hypothetical protein